MGVLQTLSACLLVLPNGDSHIVVAVCLAIFEGFIVLYAIKYFVNYILCATPAFLRELLKTLHACLFSYYHMQMCI